MVITTTPPLVGPDLSMPGKPAIYFVRLNDFPLVKVGKAWNWRKRCMEHQCGCPFPMSVIFVAPGGLREEKLTHGALAKSSYRGEWFRLGHELAAFIDDVTAANGDLASVAARRFDEAKRGFRETAERGFHMFQQLLGSQSVDVDLAHIARVRAKNETILPLSSAGQAE